MLVVLHPHTDGVVVSDAEFRELVSTLDLYTEKFEDFLRTVIHAYAAARTPEAAEAFRPVVEWIQHHYIDVRERLPADLKRLYLHEIAFRQR